MAKTNGFDLQLPVMLAPDLMKAVQLLQSRGYLVIERDRVKVVQIEGAAEVPPDNETEENKASHFTAIAQSMAQGLGVRIVQLQLAQATEALSDDGKVKKYAVRTLIVGPRGRPSSPKLIVPK